MWILVQHPSIKTLAFLEHSVLGSIDAFQPLVTTVMGMHFRSLIEKKFITKVKRFEIELIFSLLFTH